MLKHPAGIRSGICARKLMWPQHTWAFYVHEVRVRGLYKTLQLVPLGLGLGGGVEKIDGERLLP
jgi:hypothetical protein